MTNADSEIEESETTDELSTALNKDPSADRSDYLYRVLNRYYTEDKEKEILTKFSALGFIRPFSAEDAVKQNLPVKDLAFRYTEPMIHFQNRIERPSEEKIRSIRDELKNLKSEKGINDKKTTLKEQIEELEREMNVSELVVRDELLIFQDDLFAIIFEQAKEKAKKQKMIADDLRNFREYIIDNLFDSRAAESYYSQPLNQVIKELIDEYFSSKKEKTVSETKPISASVAAIATDIQSGDTFLPNVLVPTAAAEPFLSHNFQLYDMNSILETNFPYLLKLSDEDLSNASALALFELLQMGHPSDYKIDVYRMALLKEWEERGKDLFEELGFPTGMIYPYVNLHTGYKSVESLGEILSTNNPERDKWWAVAEHYRPIADVNKALLIIEQLIKKQNEEMNTLINPKINKPKLEYKHLVSEIMYAIKSLEESKEVIQHYIDNPLERNTDVKIQASLALNGVIKDNDFICLSYKNNTNGKVEKVSLTDTSKRTVLYQSDKNVINDMMPTNEGIYLKTLQNGAYKLMQISFKGFSSNEIQLPMQGGIMLKDMSECPPTYQNNKNIYFRFISPIEPQAIYSYAPEVNKVLRIKCIPEQVKSEIELVVKEIEVPSHDGVMVPLTIIYPKNCVLNGQNPTLITAYGAYGWIYDVKYDAKFLLWFKRGGLYAVAHVRGGGKKGDAWHDGGLKATKPNTWKDMIACTQYLIDNKYTSPPKLCVEGRSAGSIMVGRTVTERPDLYKAAIIGVGIPNTIREMSNTMGGAEFGSVRDSIEFQYLYEMDTYHHIFKDKKYPSILFSVALKDARIDAWQPAKGVAKFQQACTGKDNLILFRISDQGHFEERNNANVFADQFSFILWQLGHPEFQLKKN